MSQGIGALGQHVRELRQLGLPTHQFTTRGHEVITGLRGRKSSNFTHPWGGLGRVRSPPSPAADVVLQCASVAVV